MIFVGSAGWLAQSETESVVIPILSWLFPRADADALDSMHAAVRKLGHFVEYFILSMLIGWALRDGPRLRLRHAALAVALAGVYAVSDEAHQHLVGGRTAALGDVAIDVAGAIAGQIALAASSRPSGRAARRAA